jgi:hypothetical protein
MKRLLLLLLALSAAPAHAAVCHEDAIRNLTTSGTILYLVSGQIFQVYPGQETKAIFWEPLDSLTLCRLGGEAFVITNNNPAQKKIPLDALRIN